MARQTFYAANDGIVCQTTSVTLLRREATISCLLTCGSAKLYTLYSISLLFLHLSLLAKQHLQTTSGTASTTTLAHSQSDFKSFLAWHMRCPITAIHIRRLQGVQSIRSIKNQVGLIKCGTFKPGTATWVSDGLCNKMGPFRVCYIQARGTFLQDWSLVRRTPSSCFGNSLGMYNR